MPLTKLKTDPQRTKKEEKEKTCGRIKEAEKRADVVFLRCEIFEKYHWEKKSVCVIYLLTYLLISFNQLKIHAFVFYSHFQIFLLSRRSRSHL